MNELETKQCISLMGVLWSNYKAPQTEAELQFLTGIWRHFFGGVSQAEVQRTIEEMAAEGPEFAPQIGEIYDRLKSKRTPVLKGNDNPFYQAALTGAAICELRPPSASDVPTVRKWFREVFYPAEWRELRSS